jgi:hypothetical protein
MFGRSPQPPRWKVDHVIATFSPPESELPAPLQSAIGRRGRFRPLQRRSGSEPAMTPVETWEKFPFLYCPSSYLSDVEPVMVATLERRRTGRARRES